ncbi:MAG: hypothetical protein K2N07_03400 [Desulfovibrio sp.]|nr:hypothetical protein [Desulfovibrio sp.]
MFGWLKSLLGIGEKAMEKIFPDRAASREAQSRINEAEVAGAPASRLRLWRSFLGWALSVAFIWEVFARPSSSPTGRKCPCPSPCSRKCPACCSGCWASASR